MRPYEKLHRLSDEARLIRPCHKSARNQAPCRNVVGAHPMNPTITAFETSPDRGRGLARDMRVRWALEEVGQPYDVRLVSFKQMKEPEHLTRNPFGQIPTYETGDLTLFESGSIVLHIAERHTGLLPEDANARARDYLDVCRAQHGRAADRRALDGFRL